MGVVHCNVGHTCGSCDGWQSQQPPLSRICCWWRPTHNTAGVGSSSAAAALQRKAADQSTYGRQQGPLAAARGAGTFLQAQLLQLQQQRPSATPRSRVDKARSDGVARNLRSACPNLLCLASWASQGSWAAGVHPSLKMLCGPFCCHAAFEQPRPMRCAQHACSRRPSTACWQRRCSSTAQQF